MIKAISIFFFILSIIFILRYVIEIFLAIRSEEPRPININKIIEVFLYISISYILTFLIAL
jgi:hypothetical protein